MQLSKLDIWTYSWNSPHSKRTQNILKTFWTTSESLIAGPIHALGPGVKKTHKVYIHIYKYRYVSKKCNCKWNVIYFISMLPQTPKTQIALRWPIHITINLSGVYKRCKDTKRQNMTGALVRNELNTLYLECFWKTL